MLEAEFRFNHRHVDLYPFLLKMFRENPLSVSCPIYFTNLKTKILHRNRCGVVDVEVRHDGERHHFSVQLLPVTFEMLDESRDDMAKLLGISELALMQDPIMKVYSGLYWIVLGVKTLRDISSLAPRYDEIIKVSNYNRCTGICVFCLESFDQSDYHIRSIAPAVGVLEDPVCGTGNGCVSSYLIHNKIIRMSNNTISLCGEQGKFCNRWGKIIVSLTMENGSYDVMVGGTARTSMVGEIYL